MCVCVFGGELVSSLVFLARLGDVPKEVVECHIGRDPICPVKAGNEAAVEA